MRGRPSLLLDGPYSPPPSPPPLHARTPHPAPFFVAPQVTTNIANVICARAAAGRNYGVVLIPEGLIDFIPEMSVLISELNELLAAGEVQEPAVISPKLKRATRTLFNSLPKSIQLELLLDRDPHGNVQVAKIETEKLLIHTVEQEIARRKVGRREGGGGSRGT